MDLQGILNPNIIDLAVEGSTKKEVLTSLAKLLKENEYIDNVDQFVKDIYVREAEGPTGMGSHLSIPHGKSKTVKKIGIAIGRTKKPIEWESSIEASGIQQTNLVFLFCVSADASFEANHMLLLSQLAGKLGNDARIKALHDAKNAESIIETICYDDDKLNSSSDNAVEEIVDLDINL